MELTEQFIGREDFEEDQVSHSWEMPLQRSWEGIRVDESTGELVSDLKATMRGRRQKRSLGKQEKLVQKGLLRYLYIVMDLSQCMDLKDFKPSRKVFLGTVLGQFIKEFFEQNPLCSLGILLARDRVVEVVTELSGNPLHQIECLEAAIDKPNSARGEFSLQNALEKASKYLRQVPEHASREVLIACGSLTSCDPSDIFETIRKVQIDRIRCSVVSLTAEVYLHKMLAKLTKGMHSVPIGEHTVLDALREHISPLPSELQLQETVSSRKWVLMGFPLLKLHTFPVLCACHEKFMYQLYQCPNCSSGFCEVPTKCRVCGLTLVSSAHLARSYHHLFPLKEFTEIEGEVLKRCFGCHSEIDGASDILLNCSQCENDFCLDCDEFIHQVLYNCPGIE